MSLSHEKIAARRQVLGLTMDQAGERYGFKSQARQQWYALENSTKGDPRLTTVERMCEVLECSILDLLADNSPAMPIRVRKHKPPRSVAAPARRVSVAKSQKRSTPSGSAGSKG